MSSMTVTLSGDAPAHRFLTTAAAVDDGCVMRLAVAGEVPVGVTDGTDLEDEDTFQFTVSGRPVWLVESGEGIDPGNFVRSGTLGKAFVCDPGDPYAVGMAMDDAAASGTVIRVAPLRTVQVNGLSSTAPTVNNATTWADLAAAVTAFNALLAALRTRGVIGGS